MTSPETGRPNLSAADAGRFAPILVKPYEPVQLAATSGELVVDAPR